MLLTPACTCTALGAKLVPGQTLPLCVSTGTPDGSKAREMHQTMPTGSFQREQYEQGHQPARQQGQSQLMHASWSLDDEPSGGSCSHYTMSPLSGRNSPLRASPRAGHTSQPYSEQQHWQQRQDSPQRAYHSPANAAAADEARNSSPKQRRLAEAMAAEAKAAAAAVLRGPPGSGSSASTLAHRAGEQQQSRHRTPERMTHSPARSPRHAGELMMITCGVHFLSCAGGLTRCPGHLHGVLPPTNMLTGPAVFRPVRLLLLHRHPHPHHGRGCGHQPVRPQYHTNRGVHRFQQWL